MSEQIDYNKIIAEFISSKLDDLLKFGLTTSKSILKKGSDNLQLVLKTKYKNYLKTIAERFGKTRSFFIRDEPQPLYSFYIPAGIGNSRKKIEKADLKDILEINEYSIITGSGGSGKSIFLRHLLIDAIKNYNKIPVFLELRNLNQGETNFKDYLHKSLKDFGLDLDDEYFEKSLEAGHYILLLDGLDEVRSDDRVELVKAIESFNKRFYKCNIIITSRPDDRISELSSFSSYQILPLSLENSIELVKKLPADEEVKKKFINDLQKDLYVKHQSFLSNPLLLSIMLLTYGYSADIPNKLSIFYNQAYEALFQRHDALKGAYKRVKETNLDIQEFQKVLSSFCIQTYDDRKFEFSKNQALEYINKAKILTNLNFNSTDFLEDLLQSICILIQDGLFLVFTHRSFQEYFVAKFIVTSEPKIRIRLLTKYIKNFSQDNIYKLIYEMDPDYFEEEFILPYLNNLFNEIELKKKVGRTQLLKFLKKNYRDIKIDNSRPDSPITLSASINNSKDFYVTRFALYEIAKFNDLAPPILNYRKELKDKLEEIYQKEPNFGVLVNDLKTTTPFFQDLYNGEGWLSKNYLERLLEVRNYLIEKHKSKSQNLEELLFKNK